MRHLALPIEGRSPEWIVEEMEKMDSEKETHANWKDGRLSGAVYRELYSVLAVFWRRERSSVAAWFMSVGRDNVKRSDWLKQLVYVLS